MPAKALPVPSAIFLAFPESRAYLSSPDGLPGSSDSLEVSALLQMGSGLSVPVTYSRHFTVSPARRVYAWSSLDTQLRLRWLSSLTIQRTWTWRTIAALSSPWMAREHCSIQGGSLRCPPPPPATKMISSQTCGRLSTKRHMVRQGAPELFVGVCLALSSRGCAIGRLG
jgi:hypothetical protein